MGIKFIKVSVVYFVIGILLGMYMSMASQHVFASVHAHINLLGWLSFAVSGIIYHLFPRAGYSRLALVHYWLHNIGLPPMMLGLFLLLSGAASFEFLIPIGATLVVISVILFAINLLINIRSSEG
ncbi:cbb3-type cytochrome c oxidase subunit I [Paenibacillus periandrae]|uniref:cbb3-type cytochrome c oxidase subunit I n=1 Tax=Paenibacillus periandrae TaxID=1761741 RepID=UPI001F09F3D9|nr:cbb3-type cytochrome c oxidase subunit I [Paenibacillus periandrae]